MISTDLRLISFLIFYSQNPRKNFGNEQHTHIYIYMYTHNGAYSLYKYSTGYIHRFSKPSATEDHWIPAFCTASSSDPCGWKWSLRRRSESVDFGRIQRARLEKYGDLVAQRWGDFLCFDWSITKRMGFEWEKNQLLGIFHWISSAEFERTRIALGHGEIPEFSHCMYWRLPAIHPMIWGVSMKQRSSAIPKIVTGWWFGTWILFFHILGRIIQSDFHIFQRVETTNQVKVRSNSKSSWCLMFYFSAFSGDWSIVFFTLRSFHGGFIKSVNLEMGEPTKVGPSPQALAVHFWDLSHDITT